MAIIGKATFEIICDEPWFSLIKSGIKLVEGRKNSPKYKNIGINNIILFTNGNEKFKAIVTELRSYNSLEKYLKDVGFENALPGVKSYDEAINIYYQWNSQDEIEKYGFLGIFVKVIT